MNTDENQDGPQIPGCVPFMVHNTPYACWDWDIGPRNEDFLKGIDPDFYTYVVDSHAKHLADPSLELKAAMAIRLVYSQALETFFSLVGALVQAPQCAYGWLLKYRVSELHDVVRSLSDGNHQFRRINRDASWDNLSRGIHQYLAQDDEKKDWIAQGFASAWRRFAADFLDDVGSAEYNSAKHGLRTRLGGFSLSIGREEVPGQRAPQEAMHSLGGSKHGSSFLRAESLGTGSTNFRGRKWSRNWIPENMINGVHLLSMSIGNVILAMRILNGTPPGKCEFHNPDRPEAFDAPWQLHPGVPHMNMDLILRTEDIRPLSKADIKGSYSSQHTPSNEEE